MENLKKLFECNTHYYPKIELKHGILVICAPMMSKRLMEKYASAFLNEKHHEHDTIKKRQFCGVDIEEIINIVNSAHRRYGSMKFSVYIDLKEMEIIDKLTYIFLECICLYLIEMYGHPVQLHIGGKTDITTSGIHSSPLLLLQQGKRDKMRCFPDKFKFDIYGNHYRRVIDGRGKQNTNYLGNLYNDIDVFLKPFGISDQCRDDVGLVITELVGNVEDHTGSECLVDIDVAPNFAKRGEEPDLARQRVYYGINIVVMNFSDKCLGDDIKINVLNPKDQVCSERYNKVLDAYKEHCCFFSEKYTEEDFCNITAFQNKISGRKNRSGTGGTGLTTLIRSLQERSDMYRCYVISGKKCVRFIKEYLDYDVDGWLGFNEQKDYFESKPADEVLGEALVYMPGTAYNLNFVMIGEEVDGNIAEFQ